MSVLVAQSIVKSRRGLARLPRLAKSRSHLLPNGVDLGSFSPMPRDVARAALGWNEAPFVLFGADPERYEKRFELALAAVEEARRSIPSRASSPWQAFVQPWFPFG